MDELKEIIKKYIADANCGIYFTRNIVGDTMHTIYKTKKYQIDICYYYSYFEVFGLTKKEQKEISEFYHSMRGW